ncbi:hypothetical protein QT970_19880 [Microcoleus sp. herbarium8]|uniref:hypothetical protein n=1 Tax=Microcoleus sp. herbarium8 TaxID=3055436 RepID=UPI002FD76DD4
MTTSVRQQLNDILSLFDRLLQRSFRSFPHRWPKFDALKMDTSPQFKSWRKKIFRSSFKIPDSAGEQILNLQRPNLKLTDIVSGCIVIIKSSQKLTVNNQQSTANSQQSTANSQQPTVNSQQSTVNS